MIKILQSSWMSAVIGAVMYLGVTLGLWRMPKIVLPPRPTIEAITKGGAPSWDYQNPEVDEMIADLQHQKDALAEREHQLNDLAARLDAERQEIVVVTQSVAQMQSQFDQDVVRVRDEETANLKRLAKIYAAMSPDGAVSIFKEMKDDDVVKILVFMKDSETAPILEMLGRTGPIEARRAAQISERIKVAMYRNPANKPS
jgi:flagellar motility protein MotE (MotC chaperone)